MPELTGNRSIAPLSTGASFPSEEALPTEGLPEHEKSGANWSSNADAPRLSSSPSFRAKKRGRSLPSSKAVDESVDSEEEIRRVKRLKRKGKRKGKGNGTRS